MVPTNGTRESEGRPMSDEERYQIIGKTVSDHESAKRHLATLQAKAKPMSEFLYLVGSALTEQATWSVDGNGFTVKRFNSGGGPVTAHWPTAENVSALLQEIADTKAHIAELDRQRKAFGV
jgi:hypothetical protein